MKMLAKRENQSPNYDSEKKTMIQTVIVSCIIPFLYLFGVIFSFGEAAFDIPLVRHIARITLIAVTVIYYSVVMRKRKGDILLDSHTRRIWLSLRIQTVIMLLIYVLPLGYTVFFTQPENGHWYGPAVEIFLILGLISPLLIHLSGFILGIIFEKLIFRKRLKKDNVNKEVD